MEVLDSPNFAPAVQNYRQLRKLPPTVGAPIPLAQVQSSSPFVHLSFLFRVVDGGSCITEYSATGGIFQRFG